MDCDSQKPKRRRNRRLIFLWVLILLGVFILLPAVFFVAVGRNFHSKSIPPELEEPPAEVIAKFRLAATRLTPPSTNSPKPATSPLTLSFDDYIQYRLDQDPTLAGAEIYLKLGELWAQMGFAKIDIWIPGVDPVSDELAEWLKEQQELLDLMDRLIEAGGFPFPSREELLAIDGLALKFRVPPNSSRQKILSKILAAKAQHLWQEGNDRSAAHHLATLYRYAPMVNRYKSVGTLRITNANASLANKLLHSWIEQGAMPSAIGENILAELNKISPKLYSLEHKLFVLELEYRYSRALMVQYFNKPWKEHVAEIQYPIHWREVDDIIVGVLYFAKHKASSKKILKTADEYWSSVADYLSKSYPQQFDMKYLSEGLFNPVTGLDSKLYNIIRILHVPTITTRSHVALASLNLNRAALSLMLGEEAPPSSSNFSDRPNHPWRDPFTDRALHIDEATTPTLIYSIGPDLKDQKGTLEYDPTNGLISPGDMTIHVPWR